MTWVFGAQRCAQQHTGLQDAYSGASQPFHLRTQFVRRGSVSSAAWSTRWRACAAVLSVAFIASACTATSPVPPRDLASIFTPTAEDQSSAPSVEAQLEQAADASLAPKAETRPAAKPEAASNAVAALSPAEEQKPSAAAKAASQATAKKPKPSSSANTSQTAQQKPADVATAETRQLTPAPKKTTNLFDFLTASSRNNQKSSRSNASGQTKTAARDTTTTRARRTSTNGNLPGVRTKNLFGVTPGAKTKRPDKKIEVASVASRAVRGNHGLLLQRPNVRVNCFPPRLVSLLRRVERRFGRKVIVTSGFRSRAHNRRIRGARNSTHTRCLAADIQVKGISKWQMAKFLRSLPGRGGVGTYCHTKSVHIDIGKKRSWNYCSRRRGKRRRS